MSLNRILLLDAHDSFPAALIFLVQKLSGVLVEHRFHDDPEISRLDQIGFVNFLQKYTAVVAGGGPGNPGNEVDVGVISRLWNLPLPQDLPMLAVGLGAQSFVSANGGAVYPLAAPRHGFAVPIAHVKTDIFGDAEDVFGTLYTSFKVDLGHTVNENNWLPSSQCSQIQPLTWSLGDEQNGPFCVAARHVSRPHWGLLYDPASVMTTRPGAAVIRNWWHFAREWNRVARMSLKAVDFYFRTHRQNQDQQSFDGPRGRADSPSRDVKRTVLARKVSFENLDFQHILTVVAKDQMKPILVPSTGSQNRDQFTTIALYNERTSMTLEFFAALQEIKCRASGSTDIQTFKATDPWNSLKSLVYDKYAIDGPAHVPFWGGLVGFVSYNACLPSVGIDRKTTSSGRPDMAFIFTDRSMVIDHLTKEIWIQSIADDDLAWVQQMAQSLSETCASSMNLEPAALAKPTLASTPTRATYFAQISQCQERIRRGDASLLNLATTSQVNIDSRKSTRQLPLAEATMGSWKGASIDLHLSQHQATIISTKLGHDLVWARNGAIKFTTTGSSVRAERGTTDFTATQLLNSSAEKAKHTAAMDSIRSDFYAAASIRSLPLELSNICAVDETTSGWQSMSELRGEVWPHITGVDVLKRMIPAANIAGLPKKRACEILQDVESTPRGLFGGVLGFFDVGGGGDFSVIRNAAVRWKDTASLGSNTNETWTVGASACVTSESEPQLVWEEMMAERHGVLSLFQRRNS